MAPKKYNLTNTQEDHFMDLFEDNGCLYKPASKENQPPIRRKYCIIAQACGM